eukprot:199662-Pleurochrysis_carterae.AAC.1
MVTALWAFGILTLAICNNEDGSRGWLMEGWKVVSGYVAQGNGNGNAYEIHPCALRAQASETALMLSAFSTYYDDPIRDTSSARRIH